MQWRHSVPRTIMILGPAVFVFAFALDIYIPVIPQLSKIFAISSRVSCPARSTRSEPGSNLIFLTRKVSSILLTH